ncbi:hypothetical protein GCM10020369_28360 [Cryptosporangium minutisporangium]|uniref:Uncharacterized protein n=1 Tax=Cryptosporangium minutisporangium TaxID=113569 RepID=A0ABP6SXG4_9ACTN
MSRSVTQTFVECPRLTGRTEIVVRNVVASAQPTSAAARLPAASVRVQRKAPRAQWTTARRTTWWCSVHTRGSPGSGAISSNDRAPPGPAQTLVAPAFAIRSTPLVLL